MSNMNSRIPVSSHTGSSHRSEKKLCNNREEWKAANQSQYCNTFRRVELRELNFLLFFLSLLFHFLLARFFFRVVSPLCPLDLAVFGSLVDVLFALASGIRQSVVRCPYVFDCSW
ncbi:hypothetical protein L3Y34_002230 [Caenorhabditis briggsae]|uniref:Transmembrane protein n=1 Tax=Caenorhabditis briggsae TaxID=6238 RepID=A0AAE9DEX4_CAEBR|nr:hypothetical protein L3Y34_002230 [Caenorhabditis briggsae]